MLTKEGLTGVIKRRFAEGKTLSLERINDEKYSRWQLRSSAIKHYGSWTKCLIENCGQPNIVSDLTKQNVVDELLRLRSDGHSMKIADFDNWLKHGIKKHFGGYKNAKKELGITSKMDYTRLSQSKIKYTDDAIKNRLLDCHSRNFSSKEVYEEIGRPMCDAMSRRWGGLSKACVHFGIPKFKQTRSAGQSRKWTTEKIRYSLQRIHDQNLPMAANYLIENGHRSLVGAVKRYYGTWNNGLITLGYEIAYETPQYDWSKDRVKDATLSALIDGEEPTLTALSKTVRGYSTAVSKYFGSFQNVKEYCGFCTLTDRPKVVDDDSPKKYRPKLSTEEGFRREIIRLYYVGCPLNYRAIQERRGHLLDSARSLFGSWKTALEYSGLDYGMISTTDNTLSECGYDFETVLGELLKDIGVNYTKYTHEKLSPDFVLTNGEWIDAKLSEWTDVDDAVRRYLPECESLTIVYLRGRKTERYRGKKYRYKAVSVYKLTEKLPKEKRDYYNARLTEIENKATSSEIGSHSEIKQA